MKNLSFVEINSENVNDDVGFINGKTIMPKEIARKM